MSCVDPQSPYPRIGSKKKMQETLRFGCKVHILLFLVSLKQPIDIHWSWYLGCIWWWVHRMLVNVLSFLVRCTACARTCLGLKVSPCWVRRNTTSLPFGETAELGLFDPRWKNGVVMLKPAEKTDRNIWIFWGWPFCFLMWLFYVLWMRLF